LTEALTYVEKVREVINKVRHEHVIRWSCGEEDLLSALIVSFKWYFMEENAWRKYELTVVVDPRVKEVARSLFRRFMEAIPATYLEFIRKMGREALRLLGYDEEG
jgi:predicted GTPase